MTLQELIDIANEKNVTPEEVEIFTEVDGMMSFAYEPDVDVRTDDLGRGEGAVTLIISATNAYIVLPDDES
jgi:hypothetical protein